MKETEIDTFETLSGQLQGLYDEMQTLTKKSPTDAVNRFKLNLINTLLHKANDLLGDTRKPFADFSEFGEDDLPSNSDILVVLSQYLSCLEKLRADNITDSLGQWYWMIDDKVSSIRAAPPKKLAK